MYTERLNTVIYVCFEKMINALIVQFRTTVYQREHAVHWITIEKWFRDCMLRINKLSDVFYHIFDNSTGV